MRNNLISYSKRLNGRDLSEFYQFSGEVREIINDAINDGVVIVYGASDDLVEFDGAYQEEAGCYNGGEVTFDDYGTSDDGYVHANKLVVKWLKDLDEYHRLINWSYETSIPHETFMIYEDEYPYCRGIVFFLKDMKSPDEVA